ncbi:MAG: hypothetical protein EXQ85_08470 [Alphaproteobacteria bacterium]|nr:hypothetical protein [Alphaproteobacteria bacterium]
MFHVGADDAALRFYSDVLGLKREDLGSRLGKDTKGGRIQFPITGNERVHMVDFCDPRSLDDPQGRLPERLKTFRLEPTSVNQDMRSSSRPGHLGVSLYTYRVADIAAARERLKAGGAPRVTDVVADEFGQPAVSFTAPDGYFWTLVQGRA